ncbi:NAD(P)/FAD-dependent oxidoreductase [Roseospirillum parvum]|uniref:Sarcosine oxidase subunit beta n=1 Tax=Roseospirillum parvum TaxID=83401 RepID=A0A1G7WGE1_9PROT|nr:FAD-binding oxidoreductase [Roseospirillum parvum]SDG70809.1 sarcosine oxidase subunit beta [Roseospirillum parvum]
MPFKFFRKERREGRTETIEAPVAESLRPTHDVVVIGGGSAALAVAYHLAREHGTSDVAVLAPGPLTAAVTARDGAVARADAAAPEVAALQADALKRHAALAQEHDIDAGFARRGLIALAHDEAQVRALRWRAELNRHHGGRAEVVEPAAAVRLCRGLTPEGPEGYPLRAALSHPEAALLDPDALLRGYARRAAALGVALHPRVTVRRLEVQDGKVTRVATDRGDIFAGQVVIATAHGAAPLARLAGQDLPLSPRRLAGAVSQPLKRFLDPVVLAEGRDLALWQSPRGELVIGAGVDPAPRQGAEAGLSALTTPLARMAALFPILADIRLSRHWSQTVETSPDGAPILGRGGLPNLFLAVGLGDAEAALAPSLGSALAEAVAGTAAPPLIAPFAADRFARFAPLTGIAPAVGF